MDWINNMVFKLYRSLTFYLIYFRCYLKINLKKKIIKKKHFYIFNINYIIYYNNNV